MNKIKMVVTVLLVVGALAVALTGTALAQDGTPEQAPEQAVAPFHGRGPGRMLGGEVGLEAAAQVLGMTADELANQLWAGETLADLAEEAGVDLQDVRDAVDAAHEQAQRDRIEQAVEDGKLTREHADWLLEGLDKGFIGGRGFGPAMGGRRPPRPPQGFDGGEAPEGASFSFSEGL